MRALASVASRGVSTHLVRAAAAALALAGCAHTADDQLTAVEHRTAAEEHKAKGERAAAEYEPGLDVKVPARGPFIDSPNGGLTTYNPTADRLIEADREMRRASEHLAAARRLEAFEDAACREIPPAERSSCPLLASWISVVRETTTGLEFDLKPTIDGRDTHRRLECHLAWARANGFERPSCPLFLPGLKLGLRERGVSTLLFEGDADLARSLHAQARLLFAPDRFR
jgi:hypothetical protein